MTLSSLIDDLVQLLRQRFQDVVEFNEACCLKFDVRSFQLRERRPNSLADQERQDVSRILVDFLRTTYCWATYLVQDIRSTCTDFA